MLQGLIGWTLRSAEARSVKDCVVTTQLFRNKGVILFSLKDPEGAQYP
jgi:hypothetical protein